MIEVTNLFTLNDTKSNRDLHLVQEKFLLIMDKKTCEFKIYINFSNCSLFLGDKENYFYATNDNYFFVNRFLIDFKKPNDLTDLKFIIAYYNFNLED
jgi:hypothetical protein